MSVERSRIGLTLIEEKDPRILEAFRRIEAMSDDEIRALSDGEPPIIVEAGERIIARRHDAK